MEFLTKGLFWIFFALTGLFMFVYEFGYSGRGIFRTSLCQLSMTVGGFILFIIMILSFVFMWWQGGVAILISGFIWITVSAIVGNLLRNIISRKTSVLNQKSVYKIWKYWLRFGRQF
jgi:hypothetical protein